MNRATQIQDKSLNYDRCPHCQIASPLLSSIHSFETTNSERGNTRKWQVYVCSKCGGAILGSTVLGMGDQVLKVYPQKESLQKGIPPKAATFLQQAMECLHAPSGAIMLCASSVDAMLKEKGLKDGTLYRRIEQATDSSLITKEMGFWAHEVRLDANDERHADESATLPNEQDAQRCLDFTKALGLFMFVLPEMVAQGRNPAQSKSA